jgi:alkylation response protein AidB-like acyl-CoA dehydrogenase
MTTTATNGRPTPTATLAPTATATATATDPRRAARPGPATTPAPTRASTGAPVHRAGSAPAPGPPPGPPPGRDGAAHADRTATLVGAHDRMVAEGLLHLLVPAELGGAGATLPEWFDAVCTIAHADPSAGWVMGQGAIQSAWVAAAGSDEFVDAFFARPQTLASTSAGNVAAERRDGGLVVRGGRWAYASGSPGASFLGGMVRTTADDGSPSTRMAVLPAAAARIEETWDTLGLRGTASHHLDFGPEVVVPDAFTFTWPGLTIVRPSTVATALQSTVWAITVSAAAVNLGAASRSLEEAIAATAHKQHRFDTVPVGQQSTFIRPLAALTGSVELARSGLRALLEELWARAASGEVPDPAWRARLRLVAIQAGHLAADVVRQAQALVGADALHRGHVLERLVRDTQMLQHHVACSPSTAEQLGTVLLGTYGGPAAFV